MRPILLGEFSRSGEGAFDVSHKAPTDPSPAATKRADGAPSLTPSPARAGGGVSPASGISSFTRLPWRHPASSLHPLQ